MGNQTWTGLVILLLTLGAGQTSAQNCYPESIPASTPDSQLQDNGDGTITDRKTGLMWKQCAEGQSGSDCASGITEYLTWPQALQRAQTTNSGGGFAGFSDWRVPNIKELSSLIERQCIMPAINLRRFPLTPDREWYWSSSPVAGTEGLMWGVFFFDGFTDSGRSDDTDSFHLRLVRDRGSMLVGWTFNPSTKHYYKRVSCGSWKECESKAVADGAHLVTINSAEENEWLTQTFGSDYLWIGFTDEGSEGKWRWVSGEAVTYTNWAEEEPNNLYIENQSHFTNGGKWNDLDGDNGLTSDAIWEK